MADLSADPTYLAWLRALGFEDQNDQADAARKTADAQQAVIFQTPEVQFQGAETARHISGNFEDRGLFRSGEHERGLAVNTRGVQHDLAGLQLGLASQVGDIQSSLAQSIAARRRALVESELDAAIRLQSAGGV